MDLQHPQALTEPPARRRRFQWSLRTLLLLTAAVAAWTAWFQVARQSEVLRREIARMEQVARRLTVADPQQIAVVERPQVWRNEDRWQVYLPPGGKYRVRLATHEIDMDNFPEGKWEAALEPGRHEIACLLDAESSKMSILVNGQSVIEAVEAAPWNAGAWSGHGGYYDRVQQVPASEPLLLIRRRFMIRLFAGGSQSPPPGPTDGILLWIESSPE